MGMKCRENTLLQVKLHIFQATFSNDAELPHLPLPSLEVTLDLYVESLRPHLDEDEFEASRLIANRFRDSSAGQHLQQVLEKRAAEKKNWVRHGWMG
jgi:hypothetical protein